MAVIGILPLARATFDVPYAEAMLAQCRTALTATGHGIVGGQALLFDAAATEAALEELRHQPLDLLLIVQVTFTDAAMTVRIAQAGLAPLGIWAVPEPRAGGRLRLNAFCGLNLAVHALGLTGQPVRWLYADPAAPTVREALEDLLAGEARDVAYPQGEPPGLVARERARQVRQSLAGRRIGVVGEHPPGFDTCAYDPARLAALAEVEVRPVPLPGLFDAARAVDPSDVRSARAQIDATMSGLAEVDQPQLERSLRVWRALEAIARREGASALAVRCWPELFTDYGCAACGPMGLMTEARTPCACEADVYGALTSLILQEVAGAPAWLVDVVDMDSASDTGVVWHCGSAPLSMADPQTPPAAQIHSNRRMPLLQEFALKPGRITLARVSQARGRPSLVLAGAEIIAAPMSFTGTSGVVRFDRPIPEVTDAMFDHGLEHHLAMVYGEHRPVLRALGDEMGLPVVELA